MRLRRLFWVAPALLFAAACGTPTEPQPDDGEDPKTGPGDEVTIVVPAPPLILA